MDEVRRGLSKCVDKMLDYDECLTIGIKLNLYSQARDEFGIYVAINS